MSISTATVELYQTLADAWRETDLLSRLHEWWWVITHLALVDAPPPVRDCEALLQEIQEAIEDLITFEAIVARDRQEPNDLFGDRAASSS